MSDTPPAKVEFEEKSLIVRVDLTVAADVAAIDTVVERILALTRDMGCAKGKEFEIETSIREALANAIVHGCKGNPEKTVGVSVGCDESRGMVIVVRDPGAGFDPSKLPSPVTGKQLYAESGRGIYLINQLMDEVRIRQSGGTEIWMRKS